MHIGHEAGPQKVRAWGPGLHEGIVGRSADFVVESIGTEVGSLGMLLYLVCLKYFDIAALVTNS